MRLDPGGQVRPSSLFTLTLGALALAGAPPVSASQASSPAPTHPLSGQ
jgi:hypothetical protein